MDYIGYLKAYMPQIPLVIVPFRNRFQNRLRPVNRIKHVVDAQGGTILAVEQDVVLILTTDTPDLATTNEVETGSTVNGVYLKVEVNATTSAALANIYLIVWKDPGNNLTAPSPNAVGADDNKRYVIHQEMVMMQQQTNSNPRTLFNGVIAIPRGYRRNGPNDRLHVRLLAPGVNFNWCVQCHYKEFR